MSTMHFSTTLLASFLALVAAAPSNPKYLTFPITRHHNDSEFVQQHHHLLTRQAPIPVDILNKGAYYSIALNLGTPAQDFNLLLDTGSSDLWVYNITDTTDCNNNQCDVTGQFDGSASSTYNFLSDDYFIQYVSGNASGNWGTDTLTLGSVSLTDFQFACASNAAGNTGILGISVQGQESVGRYGSEYPNFPVALQNAGYIDRQVYSLYLNNADSSDGTFLIGGIDTAKYSGSLTVLPLTQQDALQISYNSITYDGAQVGGSGQAVLDSGTSLTYIPDAAYQALATKLGLSSSPDPISGLIDIPCDSDVSVEFNFDGVIITATSEQIVLSTGGSTCGFGIQSNANSQGNTLFGDTFLRNAYVVYDLQDSQIGLAQAVYTSASNIQAQNGPLSN
ncbi:aspartic peptidase domain-containing protein [Yarrowia lipolytica]|uniref:Aspartic peptidase domain-containing protein n=1 Tax=Yarrowia lipolytica TaxID=4952 RepID=A0A371C3L5_YARLL|nr:aspartic peptidase domain-containing protein [Yarrowia lipolytica]RDW30812.1 aspartic peptidase domain-containing protein [Yarrowia lipolytica]RDW37710.1 aspartic peptidase domain-containing protein [Yarrowia lipolytica]RDW48876.1 aspartic peptidase domain-containing protein [Yarrowia lipolytica]RDW55755.1 aspartic peptidase domain-containing protein [Yarrowia lipolytica]